MSILDIEAFGELGRSLPGVVSVMDATFATPYLVQPIKFGVDLVIHSWCVCVCVRACVRVCAFMCMCMHACVLLW